MRKTILALGVIGAVLASGTAAIGQHDQGLVVLSPDQMKWADGPAVIPGAKSTVIEGKPSEAGPFTMRLFLPPGTRIPPHVHTGVEHVTVLFGTFNLGHGQKFDIEKVKALPGGSFVAMPAGHAHFVQIKEATVVQLHGMGPWTVTYVDPSDDPTKKK